MPGLFGELRRRNVFRVAAAYALVAWILIEAGSVLMPTFGATEFMFQIYVVAIIVGWLVALVLSWVFEITPEGIRRERAAAAASDEYPHSRQSRGLWNIAIIGLLAIALGVSISFNVMEIREATTPVTVAVDRDSVAVLPFVNRSADPDSQVFTDGLHEALLIRLAEIESLRVISRTSVLAYRDSSKNLREIGDELDVAAILEGSVQQDGDSVRITVQLFDAQNDERIWGGSYDLEKSTASIFDLQTKMSAQIAQSLQTALSPADQQRLALIPTTSDDAYRFYVAGRNGLDQRRFESVLAARRQFEQAIALDPEFALAHAALAESIMLLMTNHTAIQPTEAIKLGTEAAHRALEYDAGLAEAHAVLGLIELAKWKADRSSDSDRRAAEYFQRAAALKPNLVSTYIWFGSLRELQGRIGEAIEHLQTALSIDPVSRVPYINLPSLLAAEGKSDESIELLLTALELFPDWSSPPDIIANHLLRMGRLDEAIAWNRLAQTITDDPLSGANVLTAHVELGRIDELYAFADAFPAGHALYPVGVSFTYFLSGEYEQALRQYEMLAEIGKWPPDMSLSLTVRSAIMIEDIDAAYRHLIRTYPGLTADTRLAVDRFNVDAIVLLAYLEQKRGNESAARELLEKSLAYLREIPRLGGWGFGILDVEALTLLGREEAALDALQTAVDAGFVGLRPFALWSIDETPLLDGLRDEPRYEELRRTIDVRLAALGESVDRAEQTGNWQALRDKVRT